MSENGPIDHDDIVHIADAAFCNLSRALNGAGQRFLITLVIAPIESDEISDRASMMMVKSNLADLAEITRLFTFLSDNEDSAVLVRKPRVGNA